MKVYVDKKPESCSECPCINEIWCNLIKGRELSFIEIERYRPKECPLIEISSIKK